MNLHDTGTMALTTVQQPVVRLPTTVVNSVLHKCNLIGLTHDLYPSDELLLKLEAAKGTPQFLPHANA